VLLEADSVIQLVYLVAKKMSRNGRDYEDYVGPLYMAFHKLAKWYNPERAKFCTYFVRYAAKIARPLTNKDCDYFPDGRKMDAYELDDTVSFEEHKRREVGNDAAPTADEIDIPRFRELCHDSDKVLFDLIFVDNLNSVEIGAVFGISRERVRQKKMRMLRRIRDKLNTSAAA
jgi:RNA polymerase sigma factor (sigma-70 family)